MTVCWFYLFFCIVCFLKFSVLDNFSVKAFVKVSRFGKSKSDAKIRIFQNIAMLYPRKFSADRKKKRYWRVIAFFLVTFEEIAGCLCIQGVKRAPDTESPAVFITHNRRQRYTE